MFLLTSACMCGINSVVGKISNIVLVGLLWLLGLADCQSSQTRTMLLILPQMAALIVRRNSRRDLNNYLNWVTCTTTNTSSPVNLSWKRWRVQGTYHLCCPVPSCWVRKQSLCTVWWLGWNMLQGYHQAATWPNSSNWGRIRNQKWWRLWVIIDQHLFWN